MPFTITMPKLSPTMEEGVIVKWHKKSGEFVPAGDLLVEVGTDKATIEYNALDEGWLRLILVGEGDKAAVNQPIAVFTAQENESLSGYKVESESQSSKSQNKEESVQKAERVQSSAIGAEASLKSQNETVLAQPRFVPEAPLENSTFEYPSERLEKRLRATPLAKKIAKERKLDLSTIKGTGPNQRITSSDLGKAQPAGMVVFGRRDEPRFAPGSFDEIPLSPMRKVIAERLQQAKTFIPHFYVSLKVDAEPLIAMREQLKEGGCKVSVNDCIVRGVALALRQHPGINIGFNSMNQTMIRFKTIDIAVAVSIEGGLITPIIRHADYKNLGEISLEIRQLAQRAREGKLSSDEYKGGSFTITNLGMYGISEFQAILNPPQAAILAVAAIQDLPVVRGGEIVPGKIMTLTASVDHRLIDGVEISSFLNTIKKIIENPALLLI